MQRRRLGTTALDISRVGLGSWAFGGGDWAFGWGPVEDQESVEAIHRAMALGINWIDTAPIYGLGHAEAVIGRALALMSPSDRPYVFTKCGLVWTDSGKLRHSLDAGSVQRQAENSLRRLGVETLDLYQIHWPIYPPDAPAEHLEEGWQALVRLREEGKVRHIGVSNFDVQQLERVGAVATVDSLQPPYSLIRRDIEKEILPYCQRREMGVLAYSPLASGLLGGNMTRERIAGLPAGDWRRTKSLDFREPALTTHLATAQRLESLAADKQVSVPALAIAWVLRHSAVTAAIVGARRAEQLSSVERVDDLRLSDEDARALVE